MTSFRISRSRGLNLPESLPSGILWASSVSTLSMRLLTHDSRRGAPCQAARGAQTTEHRRLLNSRQAARDALPGRGREAIVAAVDDLQGLRFSLVGPGRVGSSLARWALAAGAELVTGAGRAGRSGEAGWAAAPALRELAGHATQGQDLLLIAVGDHEIPAVAAELAGRSQAQAVLHTSGSLDASVLAALREPRT